MLILGTSMKTTLNVVKCRQIKVVCNATPGFVMAGMPAILECRPIIITL